MNTLKTDVVIVGAGPTGLMAANQLMRFGINFIIIDSKNGPILESRAIAVTARSMELYQQLQLDEKVLSQAKAINGFNLFSNGIKKAEIIVDALGQNYTDFNHFLLAFEQSKNEELLYQNLLNNNKGVLWDTTYVKYKLIENGIEVVALQKEVSVSIEAKFLIACDGASSPVRHQLNMPFKGGTYENKFFVADTVLNWNLAYDKLMVAPSDHQFVAFFPIGGQKNFRIVGIIPSALNEKQYITFNDLQSHILKAMKLEIFFEKVNWFSLYKLHHRCVEKFSEGKIFLAGDAAHIHSPAGGQGMNTGLQDVHNLAWKLAYVIKGYDHENLLTTYDEERKPFARWLLRFTDRGFTFVTSNNKIIRILRHYFFFNLVGILTRLSFVKHLIFKNLSQTFYHYQQSRLSKQHDIKQLKFKSGDRLPYLHFGYYKNFIAASHYLIHIHHTPLTDDSKEKLDEKYQFPITIFENRVNIGWDRFGVNKETFILVRPDLYIEEVWQ